MTDYHQHNPEYDPERKAAQARSYEKGYNFGARIIPFLIEHKTAVVTVLYIASRANNKRLKHINKVLDWQNKELLNRIEAIGEVTHNPSLFDAFFGPSHKS